MSQLSFSDFEYASKHAAMDQVVPWSGLRALIRALLSEGWRWPQTVSAGYHAAHSLAAKLVLDPAMEEALYNHAHPPVCALDPERADS